MRENIQLRELAGFKKQSFSMYYNGGEIWIEHLDGIYNHTDLVIEKLEGDYQKIIKPLTPTLMAVNLDETVITDSIISALAEKLMSSKKKLRKVVFVGIDRKDKIRIKKALKDAEFVMDFINDFEKAKEWLIKSC